MRRFTQSLLERGHWLLVAVGLLLIASGVSMTVGRTFGGHY
jgi:hypothetical protein